MISSHFQDIVFKHTGVTNLTFQGQVMSSVTWPLNPHMLFSTCFFRKFFVRCIV